MRRNLHASVVRHIGPAFCIPPDANLLAYWDLVEDRLYKIRHGMDITGALRQLSLFAPPIDPMMLVEATAAGLSLDDVQSTTSGNVPPYRFTYLIDKAKQYASQVQGFGGAVLSAIEKRDAQTLEVLRVTQQQNILGDDDGDEAGGRRRRAERGRHAECAVGYRAIPA